MISFFVQGAAWKSIYLFIPLFLSDIISDRRDKSKNAFTIYPTRMYIRQNIQFKSIGQNKKRARVLR